MRVMHLIDSMVRGGAESVVIEHVRHASPEVETWVCALNRGGPALDQAEALGAHTLVLGREGGLPARFARLASALRRARIHVVNGHNPNGGFYALAGARLAGVPGVIRTEHSFHFEGRGTSLYAPLVEGPVTALSDRVICVSDAVRASHVSRMPKLASRFVTIPNGIPDLRAVRPRAEVRAAIGVPAGVPVAFTAGSMTPQKAQHVMIEAFARIAARVPEARLVIAGEGALRPDLERRIAELGLGDRVLLLGARRDVPDLLGAADLFVLSSVREGLPMSLLEAMRASLPSVVTRVGGTPEVVREGEHAHLVEAGDVDAMAEALRDLLTDLPRARAWGAAARARWLAHFTAEAMVRATESEYREALARHGVREFAAA